MNPWDIYKLILLTPIFFPGRNPTICETHGHKGYTEVRPGFRPDHRYEGRPGHIHRGHTSRGRKHRSGRSHDTFESDTDTSDYFPARPKERGYQQHGDGRRHKSPQSTSTFSATLIDIDITSKRSTGKVKYYWDEKSRADVYTALSPYLITRVLKRDRVIWKAKGGNYPVMVSVGLNERGKPKLTVLYPRDAIETRPKPNVTTPITSHSDQSDRCLEQSDDPELVILDISLRDTFEYEYRWNKRDHLDVFTANRPYAFHSIVKGDRVLWRAKGEMYPVKVTVGINERGKPRLTVFYPREDMYTPPTPLPRVKRPPTVPTPPVPAKVKPTVKTVELDIERDRVTTDPDAYVIDRSIKTTTYTSKGGFGFSLVKQDKAEIWKSRGNEYSNKVFVYGTGKAKRIVIIYFPDGTKNVFKKSELNEPWTKTLGSKNTIDLSLVKLYTNEGNNEREIDNNSYTVAQSFIQTIYTFEDGVNCTKVTYNDREVWKRDSNIRDYPVRISWVHVFNNFSIIFKDKYISYARDGDNWSKNVTYFKV